MPAVRKAAASAAAKAEVAPQPKTADFRGVSIPLPPSLPGTFAMDLAEMEATGDQQVGTLYTLVVGIVGTDGWRLLRDKIAEDGDGIDDMGQVIAELIDAITAPYGVESGESAASAGS
jgi:hypothetical protein